MPPKQRITREMILERSFAMFCQEGMAAVNARSVAKALNCSTQPIFSYFSGMDDLKNALDQKAHDAFEQTISEDAKDGNTVESRCSAYVRFATEQPRLFAHMFLRENDQTFGNEVVRDPLVSAEAEESALVIRISNDGRPIAPDKLEEMRRACANPAEWQSGSVGLRNLVKRLTLHYAGRYSLEVKSDESNTEFQLRIPLERGDTP